MRRFRWIVVLLVAVLVAAIVAALVLVRPDLDDGRDRVDAAWVPLRPPLIARYDALRGVATALAEAGASERSVTADLAAALDRWERSALRGPRHTDPGAEATTANELEGLARRVRANLIVSTRLQGNQPLLDAMAGFDQAVVAPANVRAYNRAARAYEDDRSGFPNRLVADVLGYDPRAMLVIAGR